VKKDLAFATVESYGNILESNWRPAIGELIFEEVTYSTLAKLVDESLLLVRRKADGSRSTSGCDAAHYRCQRLAFNVFMHSDGGG
jgi:hypothetical protein